MEDRLRAYLSESLQLHLQVRPEQAISLLTTGKSYLNHIIKNGIKDNYEPIIKFIQGIFTSCDSLMEILRESVKSLPFVYSIFSNGLESGSTAVAFWSCRVLSRIAFHFDDQEIGYNWFIEGPDPSHKDSKSESGLSRVIECYRKHPDTKLAIVPLLNYFCKNHFKDFVNTHIRNAFTMKESFFAFLIDFLPSFAEQKETREIINSSGLIEILVDECIKSSSPSFTLEVRMAAVCLVSEIWLSFSEWIEKKKEMSGDILSSLKKASRDKDVSLQLVAIGNLVNILECFAVDHNNFAPYVYKTLIILLVEHRSEEVVRETLMSNLAAILQKLKYIPITVLVEPFVKQTILHGYNTNDFELFIVLARHQRLDIKQAMLLLDLFGRITLNDPAFSRSAAIPLLILAKRFSMNKTFILCMEKFTRVAITSSSSKNTAVNGKVPNKKRGGSENFSLIKQTLAFETLAKLMALNDENLNSCVMKVMTSVSNESGKDAYSVIPGLKEFISHFKHIQIKAFNESVETEEKNNEDQFSPSTIQDDISSNLEDTLVVSTPKSDLDRWTLEAEKESDVSETVSWNEISTYLDEVGNTGLLTSPNTKQPKKETHSKEHHKPSDFRHTMEKEVASLEKNATLIVKKETLDDQIRSKEARESLRQQAAALARKRVMAAKNNKQPPKIVMDLTLSAMERDLKHKEAQELLKNYIRPLKNVFETYSKFISYSIGLHTTTFQDLVRLNNAIRYPEWLKMSLDFELIPFLISKVTIANLYNTIIINETRDMNFQDFLLALVTMSKLCSFPNLTIEASDTSIEASAARVQALMSHMTGVAKLVSSESGGKKNAASSLVETKKASVSPIRKRKQAQSNNLKTLLLKESLTAAIEVLDSILFHAVGVHLIMPVDNNILPSPSKAKQSPTENPKKITHTVKGESFVQVSAFGATTRIPVQQTVKVEKKVVKDAPAPRISYQAIKPVEKAVVRLASEKEKELKRLEEIEAERKHREEFLKKKLEVQRKKILEEETKTKEEKEKSKKLEEDLKKAILDKEEKRRKKNLAKLEAWKEEKKKEEEEEAKIREKQAEIEIEGRKKQMLIINARIATREGELVAPLSSTNTTIGTETGKNNNNETLPSPVKVKHSPKKKLVKEEKNPESSSKGEESNLKEETISTMGTETVKIMNETLPSKTKVKHSPKEKLGKDEKSPDSLSIGEDAKFIEKVNEKLKEEIKNEQSKSIPKRPVSRSVSPHKAKSRPESPRKKMLLYDKKTHENTVKKIEISLNTSVSSVKEINNNEAKSGGSLNNQSDSKESESVTVAMLPLPPPGIKKPISRNGSPSKQVKKEAKESSTKNPKHSSPTPRNSVVVPKIVSESETTGIKVEDAKAIDVATETIAPKISSPVERKAERPTSKSRASIIPAKNKGNLKGITNPIEKVTETIVESGSENPVVVSAGITKVNSTEETIKKDVIETSGKEEDKASETEVVEKEIITASEKTIKQEVIETPVKEEVNAPPPSIEKKDEEEKIITPSIETPV